MTLIQQIFVFRLLWMLSKSTFISPGRLHRHPLELQFCLMLRKRRWPTRIHHPLIRLHLLSRTSLRVNQTSASSSCTTFPRRSRKSHLPRPNLLALWQTCGNGMMSLVKEGDIGDVNNSGAKADSVSLTNKIRKEIMPKSSNLSSVQDN